MSKWHKTLLIAFSLLACAPHLLASPPGAEFDAANRLYDEGKFREAADAYLELVREGNASMPVYFNLGNAFFKSGQLGRAIATYRFVESNTPRDPDLRANLRFARAQVSGPGFKEPPVVAWVRRLSLNEWAIATTAGFWITMLLLSLAQLRPQLKKSGIRYALAVGIFTLCAAICLGISVYQAFHVPRAIVISSEASVRRGPLDTAETVFTVQDGAELRFLDSRENWALVTAGEGRSGWIKRSQIQTGVRRR